MSLGDHVENKAVLALDNWFDVAFLDIGVPSAIGKNVDQSLCY